MVVRGRSRGGCRQPVRLGWKHLLTWSLFFLLVAGVFAGGPASAATRTVKLYFNGTLLNPAVAPYVDTAGRTMVPIRIIMEAMKAKVGWVAGEQKVRIEYGNTVLEMWIGKKTARLDGRTLAMDTAPVLHQGTTMVPVRVIAENFGAQVDWDASSSSVRIWLPEQTSVKQVRVRGSYVNIRPGPSTAYDPPLLTVKEGTVLPVLGKVPGWYQVQLSDGGRGWISADWVEPVGTPPPSDGGSGGQEEKPTSYVAVVGSKPVAVLAGPGPIYRQVATAPAGSQLRVVEEQQGWIQVQLETGLKGWVPASLVTLKPWEGDKGEEEGDGGSLRITGVEVKTTAEGLQLWVQGTQAFTYKTLRLYNPERLVWDIPGAVLDVPLDEREVPVGAKGVARIRMSQFTSDTVRVVADLTTSLKFSVGEAPQGKGRLFFLEQPSLKNAVIVLDPGHGTDPEGRDPGAIGPGGTQEKDINLAIALKLADLLRSEGAKVYLTREGESTPYRLAERAFYANDLGADVFLSIHSNASVSSEVGGTSTYVYAPPGTELGQQREERLRLGRSIQNALVAALGLRDIGVLEANFSVLRNTKMPSALVEVAFISNPREEKLLKDPAFQAKAAAGILEGLRRYFNS
ncbi:N-acetylmuramoyl-L-alanine amidase [Thermanaeromonas sp. C210]|nr:N-acetylmuramoyl-L-alanine amidase [Thermanaeromonas sp. C210]